MSVDNYYPNDYDPKKGCRDRAISFLAFAGIFTGMAIASHMCSGCASPKNYSLVYDKPTVQIRGYDTNNNNIPDWFEVYQKTAKGDKYVKTFVDIDEDGTYDLEKRLDGEWKKIK